MVKIGDTIYLLSSLDAVGEITCIYKVVKISKKSFTIQEINCKNQRTLNIEPWIGDRFGKNTVRFRNYGDRWNSGGLYFLENEKLKDLFDRSKTHKLIDSQISSLKSNVNRIIRCSKSNSDLENLLKQIVDINNILKVGK